MAIELGDELDAMDETALLASMKRLAVRETNPMVHRNKLRGRGRPRGLEIMW